MNDLSLRYKNYGFYATGKGKALADAVIIE